LLTAGETAVGVLPRPEPPPVVQHAGEFGEPGAQSVRHPVGHPQADLRLALHAVLPPVRFLDADAEDADDGLATHGSSVFLPVLAVRPGCREPAASLSVGDEHGGEFADALHIQRTGRAAAGVRDDAGVGVDFADLRVPEAPQVEEPLLTPEDISTPRRVLRFGGAGEFASRRCPKVFPAVLAVTHPG